MRTCFIFQPVGTYQPFFPVHRCLRVDDRRVVSDIIYVIKHGLQWKDALASTAAQILYNRLVRWSKRGFSKNFNKLSNQTPFDGSLMLDSHLKTTARRQVYSKRILHVSSAEFPNFMLLQTGMGGPSCLLAEGQSSDYKGAAILSTFFPTCTFLADGGYDASWLWESLRAKGVTVCIPPLKNRNIAFS
ncbi:MAG: hypothetical protein ACLSB9_31120 [Hydrogeniiclostridium mannosilyticum]